MRPTTIRWALASIILTLGCGGSQEVSTSSSSSASTSQEEAEVTVEENSEQATEQAAAEQAAAEQAARDELSLSAAEGNVARYAAQQEAEANGTAPNPCTQQAYGVSDCPGHWDGVQFNATEGRCETVGVGGCDHFSPFRDLASCQAACETP